MNVQQQTELFWFTRRTDPVVEAWRHAREADGDDSAYTAAIVEFEQAMPITLRGLKLKLDLLRERERALIEGDELTDKGKELFKVYWKTIDDALDLFARETKKAGLQF
jgi:hypothetical protein